MENVKIELTKRQALKLIDNVYFKIKDVLECVHYGGYHKQYYAIIQEEEKKHRVFCPDGVTCGLTLGEAVKLFYIQTLFEYLFNNRKLSSKEYLHARKSHFFACSLAENYKEELNKALQGVDVSLVNSVDYAKLMQ
jgi:hypothetical protein